MKIDRLTPLQGKISEHFEEEQATRIRECMKNEYDSLCNSHRDRPDALQSHMRNNIFPVAAAFRALLAEGMERSEAANLAGDCFLQLMEAPAVSIRRALKVPFLYRLMPGIWKTMMPKLFGEDAGFRYRFYSTGKNRVRFDMTSCPYLEMCREIGCGELAPVFCTTDDVCYGHMHKKLIWNRTKTLARGGDVCDFDLYYGDISD